MDGGQDRGHWLPLREAAAVLGLDLAALRKRAQRGTIEAEKRAGGVWFVRVDTCPAHGQYTGQDGQASRVGHGQPGGVDTVEVLRAHVATLEADVADLRRRLDQAEAARREEFDRMSQLLAAAVVAARQLPEQTARSEAATAAQNEAAGGLDLAAEKSPSVPPAARPGAVPWWRRWLGLAGT